MSYDIMLSFIDGHHHAEETLQTAIHGGKYRICMAEILKESRAATAAAEEHVRVNIEETVPEVSKAN